MTKLIVSSAEQRAELWTNSRLLKTYLISTASNGLSCVKGSYGTPEGRLRVASKIGEGLPLGAVLKARVPTGELWSADLDNPLAASMDDLILTRVLWLEGSEAKNANTLDRFIYLHGTNQEHLLGTPASHGCVRFSNRDILEIFEWLEVGSEIEIF